VSVIGSILPGSYRPSNESHQPTDPAESSRYQVDPGAKNEQRADKIQHPTDTLGIHNLVSGKLSTRQNRGIREPLRDVEDRSVAAITGSSTRSLIAEVLNRIEATWPGPAREMERVVIESRVRKFPETRSLPAKDPALMLRTDTTAPVFNDEEKRARATTQEHKVARDRYRFDEGGLAFWAGCDGAITLVVGAQHAGSFPHGICQLSHNDSRAAANAVGSSRAYGP
jgi:hypothetical protein